MSARGIKMINKIQEIADKYGVYISYKLVNQKKEGNYIGKDDKLTTCTVYVDDENGEEIACESHDTIEIALSEGVVLAEQYIEKKRTRLNS